MPRNGSIGPNIAAPNVPPISTDRLLARK